MVTQVKRNIFFVLRKWDDRFPKRMRYPGFIKDVWVAATKIHNNNFSPINQRENVLHHHGVFPNIIDSLAF